MPGRDGSGFVCRERHYSALEVTRALDSGRAGSVLGLMLTGCMTLQSHWLLWTLIPYMEDNGHKIAHTVFSRCSIHGSCHCDDRNPLFWAPLIMVMVINSAIDNGKISHGINCIFPETNKHDINSIHLKIVYSGPRLFFCLHMSCLFYIIRVWSVGVFHINEVVCHTWFWEVMVTSEWWDAFQKAGYSWSAHCGTLKADSTILRLIKV